MLYFSLFKPTVIYTYIKIFHSESKLFLGMSTSYDRNILQKYFATTQLGFSLYMKRVD